MNELIQHLIKNSMLDLFTSMPGKIVSYDEKEQKASVLPLLSFNDDLPPDFNDNEEFDVTKLVFKPFDIIYNVPVQHACSNDRKTFVVLPVKKGDLGMIHFAMRSLDEYLASDGSTQNITDFRDHDINDAYFTLGALPFKKALTVANANDLYVVNDKTEITVKPDGKISIKDTAHDVELVQVVYDIIDLLTQSTTATLLGPQPLSKLPEFAILKTRLANMKVVI